VVRVDFTGQTEAFQQSRIYSCEVPIAIKMWRPPSAAKNLSYDNYFSFLIFYDNYKYKLTFCDFRETNVSIKYVDSISVLWWPRGDRPGRPPPPPTFGRDEQRTFQIR
jgi:hypothetical protein